jgi:hypothetical protein
VAAYTFWIGPMRRSAASFARVFGDDYRPQEMHGVDTEALVIDAFAQLGIEARLLVGAPDRGVDLVLDPDGIRLRSR